MPFERFAADDPSQIVMGLFNGELIAVFMFHELEPGCYQAHFSTQRKADRIAVLSAAAKLVEWFKENDLQMVAFVTVRNKPLQRFIENAGLYSRKPVSINEIPYFAYSNGPF
jgi:hypothetical protein